MCVSVKDVLDETDTHGMCFFCDLSVSVCEAGIIVDVKHTASESERRHTLHISAHFSEMSADTVLVSTTNCSPFGTPTPQGGGESAWKKKNEWACCVGHVLYDGCPRNWRGGRKHLFSRAEKERKREAKESNINELRILKYNYVCPSRYHSGFYAISMAAYSPKDDRSVLLHLPRIYAYIPLNFLAAPYDVSTELHYFVNTILFYFESMYKSRVCVPGIGGFHRKVLQL